MDELRESSLLFSLEGLMETERERVQREAREAQRRREDELSRVAELAERRRVAVQREREARERRQALEREREQLEQTRLEALKQATVERVRIEAEAGLRLVEAEHARKHDLALAQLVGTVRTTRYRAWAWLSTGALAVTVLAAFSAYFGFAEPAQVRELQHLQSLLTTNTEQAKTTERALAAERSRNHAQAERIAELEAQTSAPKPAPVDSPKRPPRHVEPPPPQHHENCVDDGDPLNRCLGATHRR